MVTTSISVDGTSVEVLSSFRGGRGWVGEDGVDRNSYLEYSILQRTGDRYGRTWDCAGGRFRMVAEVNDEVGDEAGTLEQFKQRNKKHTREMSCDGRGGCRQREGE